MPISPALAPAVAFALAASAAPHLAPPPMPALFALSLLALALGGRSENRRRLAGVLLGLACGWAAAEIFWLEPERRFATFDLERPVEMVARVSSHATAGDDAWLLAVRVERLIQGRRIERLGFDVLVSLPEASPRPAIGSALRFKGFLRRARDLHNPPVPPPKSWRLRVKSARLVELERPPPWFWRLADGLRRRAEAALDAVPGEGGTGRALARALVLGDRSGLSEEVLRGFRRFGLAHLLAVSGLHFGFAAAGLWLLGLPLRRPLRLALVAAGVLAYLLVVGPRPGVLRAATMALLALAALACARPPSMRNALALAALAALVPEPSLVEDPGFRLSFAATLGLLVLAPALTRRWHPLPSAVGGPLAATTAAQAATLPFLLPLQSALAPLGLLWNLLAVPWAGLCLTVAFGHLVLALCSLAWATRSAWVLELLALPLEILQTLPASPWLWLPLHLPEPLGWMLAAAILAMAWWPRRLLPVFLAAALAAGWLAARPAEGPLEVRFLDVGQGDAILIRDGKRAVLVDGGGWPRGDLAGRVLVPALAAAGIHRLEAVVSTHPDQDHCDGLAGLVAQVAVDEVWMGPGWLGDGCAEELLRHPGSRWRPLWRARETMLGRWRLRVLHPAPGERSGRNDRSLVLRAEAAGVSLLLTGDVEAAAERELLAHARAELEADVLKVAHHGSKTSTTPTFLRVVDPRIALISAGRRNPYHHPSKTVVERLERAGIWVLSTREHGQVRLRISPGGALSVELPASPPWNIR